MKNKFAALIMATFVAMPVMAQDFNNQVFANQNVKAIELSQTEMKETQGEFIPLAILGGAAVSGAITHGVSYYQYGRPAPLKQVIPSMALGGVTGGLGKAGQAAFVSRGVIKPLATRGSYGVTVPLNTSGQIINGHFNGHKK
ncbi:hypothetical protein [Wielerella bovis]|uniref:hypothetical protein n=1 Tax=Wielerella bovis TaxID=2917790 RepID=UPI002019ACF7|nr:hypothetical protein [Wielerella bovis]MCG7656139.1 hypothetical protein [Wielerella bovis]MCG7658364.1 hypothetical protein [Wielerella bovis]